MIARIEFAYHARAKLVEAAKDPENMPALDAIFHAQMPTEEHRVHDYMWPSEMLIDLETDGKALIALGATFEVKSFKGTIPLSAVLPDSNGGPVTVYVQVPHIGLLAMNEVTLEENCCTDLLQRRLDEGWRILCVCPPNAQRRPDYILGRVKGDDR